MKAINTRILLSSILCVTMSYSAVASECNFLTDRYGVSAVRKAIKSNNIKFHSSVNRLNSNVRGYTLSSNNVKGIANNRIEYRIYPMPLDAEHLAREKAAKKNPKKALLAQLDRIEKNIKAGGSKWTARSYGVIPCQFSIGSKNFKETFRVPYRFD